MKKLIFLLMALVLNLQAQEVNENFGCKETEYSFKECKFEVPDMKSGESKTLYTKTGSFEGNLIMNCNNGKRTIVGESCNYAVGAPEDCKGIKGNTWTSANGAICSHESLAVTVQNGSTHTATSKTGNGSITYSCKDTILTIDSKNCFLPKKENIMTSNSVGELCETHSIQTNAIYDNDLGKFTAVEPTDVNCKNVGHQYKKSAVLSSTDSDIQLTQKSTYDTVCCSNTGVGTQLGSLTVTKINNDCASVSGIINGDVDNATGLLSLSPSDKTVLDKMCRSNNYSKLTNKNVEQVSGGGFVYLDEFKVDALCCGNETVGNTNEACKGDFISQGSTAEAEAQAKGVSYICDNTNGNTECYVNKCTDYQREPELCKDCELGAAFTFTANNNTCNVPMNLIRTGKSALEKFYNPTHSGYANVACMNGQESVLDSRCFRNCTDTRVQWTNDKGNAVCYSDLTGSKYRHYLPIGNSDRSNPNLEQGDKTGQVQSLVHTGVAEFECSNGTWTPNREFLSKNHCYASCAAGQIAWGEGIARDGYTSKEGACRANVAGDTHFLNLNMSSPDPVGTGTTRSNNTASTGAAIGLNVGSTNYRCNDGNFQIISDNNNPTVCNLDCKAQTVSWSVNGGTASSSVAAAKHGQQLDVWAQGANAGVTSSSSRTNRSGATLICNDGKFDVLPTPTVWKDCAAGSTTRNSQNYNNVCTFSWIELSHQATGNLSAGGLGTGSATYTCNDGVLSLSNVSCNKTCDSANLTWYRTGNSCPIGYTASGGACIKTNTVAPQCDIGFNYSNGNDRCEKTSGTNDTYPAVYSCDSPFNQYSVNGTNCDKTYTYQPTCPTGQTWDGAKCAGGTGNSGGTWTCPVSSLAPSSPSGVSAGNWNYYASYNLVTSNGNNCNTTTVVGDPTLSCEVGKDFQQNGVCTNKGFSFRTSDGVWNCCTEDEEALCNDSQPICSFKVGYPVNVSCPQGSSLNYTTKKCETQASGSCGNTTTTLTNICLRDLTVSPSCESGFTLNNGKCEKTSTATGTLTCNGVVQEGFTYGLLTSNEIEVFTKNGYVNDNCDLGFSNYCCLSSTYNCKNGQPSNGAVCDWFAQTPLIECPSGNCNTVIIKDATCPTGYELSGSNCVKKDHIPAEMKCPDNTNAVNGLCSVSNFTNGQCAIITLDNGVSATGSLNLGSCEYKHTVNATENCPLGGTASGGTCYKNGTVLETKAPICINGGTLNTGTDLCVATESVPSINNDLVQCKASTLSSVHGNGSGSLIDSLTDGATGNATFSCNDGNWIQTGGACYKDCSNTVLGQNWALQDLVPNGHPAYGLSCVHNGFSTSSYGHSMTTSDVSTTNTNVLLGTVQYRCNDGDWQQQNATCTRVSCLGTGVSWSANSNTCNTTSSTMKYGDTQNINQPAGYSGVDATYQCLAGGGIAQSNSGSAECLRDCSSGNYNWNNSNNSATCSSFISVLLSGSGQSISDNSGSTRGTANASCYNGTITLGSEICNNSCAAITETAWSEGFVGCVGGGISERLHGETVDIDSISTNKGSAKFTCNNGNFNVSGQSCKVPTPPAKCGNSANKTFSDHPNTDLCDEGTASLVAYAPDAKLYSWSCKSGNDTLYCYASYENDKAWIYTGFRDSCLEFLTAGESDSLGSCDTLGEKTEIERDIKCPEVASFGKGWLQFECQQIK